MPSPLVYFLDQLDSTFVGVAGGKGASLGELVRAGAPVPPAFVVSSAAFKIFMDCGDHRVKLSDALCRCEEKRITVAEASAAIKSRLADVRAGRRFVFQSIDGNDTTRFVSQTGYLLMRLTRGRRIATQTSADEIAGQAAWPGDYRGRARLVLSADAIGLQIEEGEVLVSIQSSPELMPLLEHCGAIVTDDGGIACHAAIISRELRKPTLIGTRTATSAIRTGDLIEVDTYAAVVRILERAGDANR